MALSGRRVYIGDRKGRAMGNVVGIREAGGYLLAVLFLWRGLLANRFAIFMPKGPRHSKFSIVGNLPQILANQRMARCDPPK
jgi:hypothetical protein